MAVYLVSHTHWDREWYRTFQAFRSRLVDAVDQLLDLVAADEGYRFVLDGQAVVVEDYLAVRPHRRQELVDACREGRIAIGPWYVQPDSLLPSGESHIRNLLEGCRVGGEFGKVSTVAYTPDSFGHPSTFPMLFGGFGLTAFVYWRGNPDTRPEWYRWVAPDGSAIPARHLRAGYFGAAGATAQSVDHLAALARTDGLLMNGFDHARPDADTRGVADALSERLGQTVRRALLDEAVVPPEGDLPEFAGELVGGRDANLLPGVWSARLPLKLRNRECEAALEGWAEPWAALGAALGCPDERPALRLAWRALLQNQAHDSIGGCSVDAVHEQMLGRYDESCELATETTGRLLERLAGLGPGRVSPSGPDLDIAVFNPSPHARSDVVRMALDGFPAFTAANGMPGVHPLLLAGLAPAGYQVDGRPVRVVESEDGRRVRILSGQRAPEVELVVNDLPAFGYRRVRLTAAAPADDEEDAGREIGIDGLGVIAGDDGTLTVQFGDDRFAGLFGVEDVGDRGDSYDHDAVLPSLAPPPLRGIEVTRLRHPAGIQHLRIRRVFAVPSGLDASRKARRPDDVDVVVTTVARVAPGVARLDVEVEVDNQADDHRLRLVFPTGRPVASAWAATTLGVADRPTATPAASGWLHPPPATFPHQGWVAAGGLTVVAPGLPEAEVTPAGTIAITLVRAVGWLGRFSLRSRPVPAAPEMAAPGAQCRGRLRCRVALLGGCDPAAARDAELGLRAVFAGADPLLAEDTATLEIEPQTLVLSAVKPSDDGGVVVRVLNPAAESVPATIRVGGLNLVAARPVRLDEQPAPGPMTTDSGTATFDVPPHGVRSVHLSLAK
jgi:mannosylglycerate hydrolase